MVFEMVFKTVSGPGWKMDSGQGLDRLNQSGDGKRPSTILPDQGREGKGLAKRTLKTWQRNAPATTV